MLEKLLWFLHRRAREQEMERELQSHLETEIEEQIECGLTREEASRAAHREMGNLALTMENARTVWRWGWLDDLWRDLIYSVRGLRRERTFALTVILTLALSTAVVTTVFSVADAALWRPLPFTDPDRLVIAYSRGPEARAQADTLSESDLRDWRLAAPAFTQITTSGRATRLVLKLNPAESVRVTEVTTNYLSTLGRALLLGVTPRERGIVLTDRAWRRLFNGDRSIIGRIVTMDDEALMISGVVAADDSLGPDPDLFLIVDDRASISFYGIIGRLAPGVNADVARLQLQSAALSRPGHTIFVQGLHEYYSSYNWRPLYFLLGAAMLVMLLSIVNVASLVLSRAFRRTREFALRGALGGSRRTLLRQLLVEGALLAAAGGALGLAVTVWTATFFGSQIPEDYLWRGNDIPIDWRAAAFVVLVSLVSTFGLVLAPMLVLRRCDLSAVLSSSSRTGRAGSEGRIRAVLLTTQIAMTVVLLSGAAVFTKSFVAMSNVPLGFDPANTLVLRSTLSGPRYSSDSTIRTYVDRLLEEARSTPGVQKAAIGTTSPLGSGPAVPFSVGKSGIDRAIIRAVSPAYFQTLGIRIQQGREFEATDITGAARVAVINETLAREQFGHENPIGRVIDLLPGARTPWTRKPGQVMIVGVASNVKDVSQRENDFPDIYVPFAQMPAPWVELIARNNSNNAATLRSRMTDVDPAMPVTSLTTYEGRVTSSLQGDRFNLLLISGFAGIALLLAVIGIYGAIIYNVQQRTRELGVRLALGARPGTLVGAVLAQAARFGILGGTLGILGTLAISRIIGDALYIVPGSHDGLLYSVSTSDPWLLAGSFLGIVLAAIIASSIPAYRVAHVDPVLALRNE